MCDLVRADRGLLVEGRAAGNGVFGRDGSHTIETLAGSGLWQRIHHLMLSELKRHDRLELHTTMIDSAQVRAFGGSDRSGSSSVDRRKPGTKYTVLVDARSTPPAMPTAAANVSDHRQILSTVVRFPRIGGRRGRPRNHPTKLYTDAGYDSDAEVKRWIVALGADDQAIADKATEQLIASGPAVCDQLSDAIAKQDLTGKRETASSRFDGHCFGRIAAQSRCFPTSIRPRPIKPSMTC